MAVMGWRGYRVNVIVCVIASVQIVRLIRRLEVYLFPIQYYIAGGWVLWKGLQVFRQLLAEVFHHVAHRVGGVLASRLGIEALAQEADHMTQFMWQDVRQPPVRYPLIEEDQKRLLVILLVNARTENAHRHIIRTDRMTRARRHLLQVVHTFPVESPQFHLHHGPCRAQVVSCDCFHLDLNWSQRKDLRGDGLGENAVIMTYRDSFSKTVFLSPLQFLRYNHL